MPVLWSGPLHKMQVQHLEPVQYFLGKGEACALNTLLGQTIHLSWSGKIQCQGCGQWFKKAWREGYCFRCSQSLARCDLCVLKPETCHFAQGTCREPEWGLSSCMVDHVVYLAQSGGLKVGLTRQGQIPTRFIDQGASSACPLLKVSTRHIAGLVEVAIAKWMSDKTDWRKMLKGIENPVDWQELWQELQPRLRETLEPVQRTYSEALQFLEPEPLYFQYPVQQYPHTIKILSLDKTPEISGTLKGIRGQYLLLDSGQFNLRKWTGYEIALFSMG